MGGRTERKRGNGNHSWDDDDDDDDDNNNNNDNNSKKLIHLVGNCMLLLSQIVTIKISVE